MPLTTATLPAPTRHMPSAGDDRVSRMLVVRGLQAFDDLREEWNNVVDRIPVSSPFLSWAWNRTWWKHLGGENTLQILVCRQGGEAIGILPFYRRRYGMGGIGPTGLIPVGSHHHKFGLTEQWEPIFLEAARAEIFGALSTWLEQNSWSLVVLPGLEDSDRMSNRLEARVVIEDRILLHTLQLPSSWEEFIGGLSKNLRKNARRYPQRLIDDGYTVSFHVAETPEQVSAALPTFLELHRARSAAYAENMWIRHSDRFRFANRRAFLREVATTLSAKDQFKIGLLEVGDKVVACQTWLQKGDAIYLYHSGVLPRWAEYSVGFVTELEVFKYGIARGIRRVELLRGEGHYKDRWRATPHVQRTLVLARHPRLVKAALALRIIQRRVRRRVTRESASR